MTFKKLFALYKGEERVTKLPDLEGVMVAYSSQIELFGSFLVDNDQKRDQFFRFYLSLVVTSVGFAVFTVASNPTVVKDFSSLDHTSDHTTLKLIALLMLLMFLIGLVTYGTLLKFRVLHVVYVKLLNRSRGSMIVTMASYSEGISKTMKNAWSEYTFDDYPPFLKTSGLEHALMNFQALVNSMMLSAFITLFFVGDIGSFQHLQPAVTVTLIISACMASSLLFHFQWTNVTLAKQDHLYSPRLTFDQFNIMIPDDHE